MVVGSSAQMGIPLGLVLMVISVYTGEYQKLAFKALTPHVVDNCCLDDVKCVIGYARDCSLGNSERGSVGD